MDRRQRRDRLGRLYWVDVETGRRVRAPLPSERPRAYRRDKNGRGYWTWLDTGRRAPKPEWDDVPRWDAADRPLDSTGRRIPRLAIATPKKPAKRPAKKPAKKPTKRPVKKPAKKPVKRLTTKPKRKKGVTVRGKIVPRVRHQIRRGSEAVPGFHAAQGAYVTRPSQAPPSDLDVVFQRWLKGAVRKSPMASASEIGFRQSGVVFRAHAALDMEQLAELTESLRGQPIRLVYRMVGLNEWEVWMHTNLPDRRTGEIRQLGFQSVGATMVNATKAAQMIYDFLFEFGDELSWHQYFETDDTLYEG